MILTVKLLYSYRCRTINLKLICLVTTKVLVAQKSLHGRRKDLVSWTYQMGENTYI